MSKRMVDAHARAVQIQLSVQAGITMGIATQLAKFIEHYANSLATTLSASELIDSAFEVRSPEYIDLLGELRGREPDHEQCSGPCRHQTALFTPARVATTIADYVKGFIGCQARDIARLMADAFKTYVGIVSARPGADIQSPTINMLIATARGLESRGLLAEGPPAEGPPAEGPPLLADSAEDRARLAWYLRYIDAGVDKALAKSAKSTAYQCRVDVALNAIERLIDSVGPIGALTHRHRQFTIRPSARKSDSNLRKAAVTESEFEMLNCLAPHLGELHGIVTEPHLRAATTPLQRGRYWRAQHLVRLVGESAVLELNDTLDLIAQAVARKQGRAARAECAAELYRAQYGPMHQRLERLHRLLGRHMSPFVQGWLSAAGANDVGISADAPAAAARLRAWITAYAAAPHDGGHALHRIDMCVISMHISAIDADIKEVTERLNSLRALASTPLLEVPDDPVTEFDVLIDCVYGRQSQFDQYVAVTQILNKMCPDD